ncbi:MAG: hypothetical protein Q8P89_03770 [bacterium]|nr:hypothetical protein [bacterium]
MKRWSKENKDSINSSPKYKDFIFAVILSLLNFFFIWPFFGQSYPQAVFPTPVLPLLARIVEFLTPWNFAQAVAAFVLLSFPASSLAWYLFFRKLSGNVFLSFLAGLIFLLPWLYLPRFALFWQRGDGIHALGFAVLPLVGIVFIQFLRVGTPGLFLTSFLGVGLVSLISPFALLNLYFFFLVLTVSEMLLGSARVKILRFLMVSLFAQSFSSFWYHPEFLFATIRSDQGREVLSSLWQLFPISLFTVPVFGAISFLVFDRKPHLQSAFFAFATTTLYFGLVAVENISIHFPLPFPARFYPEFYIGLALFLAVALNFLIKLPRRGFSLGEIHPHLAFVHHSSELFLTTLLVAFMVWPVFSLVSGSPVIPQVASPQVLGVQSASMEVLPGGISQMVGYGISFLTAAAGVFLKMKIKT